MILALLEKDLRRLRRNWSGFIILLAMPIGVTALVGSVFGPAAREGEVPRIRLAIINDDQGMIGNLIASSAQGEQAQTYFDVVSHEHGEALRLIEDDRISAIVVIPAEFTDRYLSAEAPPPIQLIKNPTERYMPAITEELLLVVVEALNAVSENFIELPEVAAILDSQDPDTTEIAHAVVGLGDRLARGGRYVLPPVIGYRSIGAADSPAGETSGGAINVFTLVMPGMIAMFLLFTAETTAKDLLVERRNKTLNRYRTCRPQLLPFFISKALYSFVVVLLAAAIMLIGGSWIFDIHWQRPFASLLVTVAYSAFCVGFAFLLVAAIYREKLVAILTTIIIMLMAFLGGSMLPVESLPSGIRDTIAPVMPNHLFAESMKELQRGIPGPHWLPVAIGLTVAGGCLAVAAIALFRFRLHRGAAE